VSFRDYWYVLALSEELRPGKVLARKVLGEWLAVFRDAEGRPRALQDRCVHRNSRLSPGVVEGGCLRCPYHGWLYDAEGQVIEVPAEGPDFKMREPRRAITYETCEADGFVYGRLEAKPKVDLPPFSMPSYGAPGYRSLRLVNRFENNVTNCAENFIDVPHTVYVHPGIFRSPRRQRIEASIQRREGQVHIDYRGETDNLGWFAWFLNPKAEPILHRDSFHLPNVTSVEYRFGPRRHLFITSQSVPEEDDSTLVYTDLTYDFGLISPLVGPVLRFQGQAVIDQDLVALARQMETIRKYGESFNNTSADIVHVYVESLREAIAKGEDPRELPELEASISFWV